MDMADTTATEITALKHITIGGKTYDLGGGGLGEGHTLTVQMNNEWSENAYNVLICVYADGTSDAFYMSGAAGAHKNVYAYCLASSDGTGILYFDKNTAYDTRTNLLGYFWDLHRFRRLDQDTTVTMSSKYTCLLYGTRIRLADGRDKSVEDIAYDDDLLVWDFDKGELGSAKPSWIKKAQTGDYYFRNRYASGRELLATGRSDTGWAHRHFDIERGEFLNTPSTVGDRIYTLDGADRHVASEYVEGKCEYYNILTARHFNLFANGVLTSCRLNNFRKIENMKFVGELAKERVGRGAFEAAYLKLSGDGGANAAGRWYDALRCDEMPRARTEELAKYAFEREVIKK